MKCKSCGYEFSPRFSAKFCPECGTSVDGNDKVRCRKCNYEMDSNLKYCSECGEPINLEKRSEDRDRNRRDRDRGGDDDEGGILGGIGDFVGRLLGG